MANKFVIEVRARGFANLETQLNRSNTAMKKFDNTGGRIRGTTSGLRREIGALRNNLLLYTFAIGAATRAMSKFVMAASRLQEQTDQFKIVFGEAADEALEFANTLSTSFKRSESDIIALMASLQDTFVPLGFSRQEAAKLSKVLTQLSYDVGAFKDASSAEVSHAFTSAIVGNHEAVRRFGIMITEAQLKQEALKLGFGKTSSELTSQQKVLARTSLIIQSTTDAHGNLLLTQHEFASQVRMLQDEFKDLSIEIGKVLMPLARFGINMANVAHLKGYALGLGLVALGYLYVQRATISATIATHGFRLALIKTGVGIAVLAFGELAARTIFAEEATKDNTKALIDYKTEMDSLLSLMSAPTTPSAIVRAILEEQGFTILSDEEIAKRLKASERQQDEKRRIFLSSAKEIETIEKQLTETLTGEQDTRRDSFARAQSEIEEVAKQLTAMLGNEQDTRRDSFLNAQAEMSDIKDSLSIEETFQQDERVRVFEEASAEIIKIENSVADERKLSFLSAQEEIERIEKQLTTMFEREQDARRDSFFSAQEEIKEVRDSLFIEETFQQDESRRVFKEASDEKKRMEDELAKSQLENIQRVTRGFRQFSDNLATAIVLGQDLGDAIVNSLKAIAAELAAQAVSFMILNMLLPGGGASASKMGFDLLGSFIGHKGGAVTKDRVQSFAGGGVVRGKDNVPILAQAGEFIMRREAVQSIGLDQLHQMNQTGQSNNLTVNISAPMVDETVIDHIIPAIEKAARFDLA